MNYNRIHFLCVVYGFSANLVHQNIVLCIIPYLQYRPLLAGYIVTTNTFSSSFINTHSQDVVLVKPSLSNLSTSKPLSYSIRSEQSFFDQPSCHPHSMSAKNPQLLICMIS